MDFITTHSSSQVMISLFHRIISSDYYLIGISVRIREKIISRMMIKRITILLHLSIMLMAFMLNIANAEKKYEKDKLALEVKVRNSYENLPLCFIQNNGQIDEKVKYYEKGRDHSTYFTHEGVHMSLTNRQYNYTQTDSQFMTINAAKQKIPVEEYLELTFIDVNPNPVIVAADIQEGKVNFFIGNDSEKWKVNVPTYKVVSYKDIYKGIDMKFYGNNHCLEYDVIVKPGSDPSQVKFAYEGIKGMRISDEGNMEISLNRGKLIHKAPYIYQEIDGKRQEIKGKFIIHELTSEDTIATDSDEEQYTYGFHVASYDKRYALIIDPVLTYSTYLGGSGEDVGLGIAVDDSGDIYVTGHTASTDFPLSNAIDGTYGGGTNDIFITKINADGSGLIYSTYLGGSGFDETRGEIDLDTAGNVYISGSTSSVDFPTFSAIQQNYGGGFSDAFVTKINSSGSALVYSTFLGGDNIEDGNSICVDNLGNAYIAGETASDNFPIVNAIQSQKGVNIPNATTTTDLAGNLDAEFDTGAVQHVLTGTTSYDVSGVDAVATDALNSLDENTTDYVAGDKIDIVGTELDGTTVSTTFRWGAALDGITLGDLRDFISVSFGSATATISNGAIVLTADAPGATVLALTISASSGNTGATTHPGLSTTTTGSGDVYVTTMLIFDALGISHLVTLTFNKTASNTWNLTPTMSAGDGSITDGITSINFNNNGSFSSVTGTSSITVTYPDSTTQTVTLDIGIPNAFSGLFQFGGSSSAAAISQDGSGYGSDAFVTKINSAGSAIVYSTFLGGSQDDGGNGVTVDDSGNAYIIGETSSADFPIVNAIEPNYGGAVDTFVLKINPAGSALVYSTFLGGSGFDHGEECAVDSSGNVYIVGSTGSIDFPVVNAIQPNYGYGEDAFVTKINPAGSAIVYSTYIGGYGKEDGGSIDVDNSGNVYITGETASYNFPIIDSIQAFKGGLMPRATSIIEIAENLDAQFSTGAVQQVLTTSSAYQVSAVAAVATDTLNSLDLNTTDYVAGDTIDVVGTEHNGTAVSETFQWGASLDGTTLGDLRDFISSKFGTATANIDSSGNIVLTADAPGTANLALTASDTTGNTGTTTHPTYTSTTTGSGDVYITTISIFDSLGISHLVTLTFNKIAYLTWELTPTMLAGDGSVTDAITSINFNSDGSFSSVTGTPYITITYPDLTTQTVTLDFGTPHAFSGLVQFDGTSSAVAISQDGRGYGSDAFVTKINSTGSAIIYSTYLGGSGGEGGDSITVDNFGNAYIIGFTDSNDFPTTTGAFDVSYNGNRDAFVVKLSTTAYGRLITERTGDIDGSGQNDLIVDYGSGLGTWVRMNNSTWVQLHTLSAETMAIGDIDGGGSADVILDLGSFGIWARMNNSTWVQLHTLSPEIMIAGDIDGSGKDDIIVDFGSLGVWVRMNDSTWVQLHTLSPETMAIGDIDGGGSADVILDFGSFGIWVRMNNSTWVQLHTLSPEIMITGDMDGSGKDDIVVGFGGLGTWVRMNDSSWVQLHTLSPETMSIGDIDGGGSADVTLDFGSLGVWARMNNSTWVQLHTLSSETMTTGDLDGGGQDDVIIDFGVLGIWIRMNNSTWSALLTP